MKKLLLCIKRFIHYILFQIHSDITRLYIHFIQEPLIAFLIRCKRNSINKNISCKHVHLRSLRLLIHASMLLSNFWILVYVPSPNRLLARFLNVFFRFSSKHRDVSTVCLSCFVASLDPFSKNVTLEVSPKWLKSYNDKYYVVISYMAGL